MLSSAWDHLKISHSIKVAKAVRKQFTAEHFLPFVYFKGAQLFSVLCHLVAGSLHYSLRLIVMGKRAN